MKYKNLAVFLTVLTYLVDAFTHLAAREISPTSRLKITSYSAPVRTSPANVETRGFVLADLKACLFAENSPFASKAFWGAAAGAGVRT